MRFCLPKGTRSPARPCAGMGEAMRRRQFRQSADSRKRSMRVRASAAYAAQASHAVRAAQAVAGLGG
jgi:hypothetical protein